MLWFGVTCEHIRWGDMEAIRRAAGTHGQRRRFRPGGGRHARAAGAPRALVGRLDVPCERGGRGAPPERPQADEEWTEEKWRTYDLARLCRVEEALPPGGTSAPQICNLDCQYPNLISNHPIREPSNPPSGETVPVIAELVLNQNQPSLSLRSS